jgi:hypothetical protein
LDFYPRVLFFFLTNGHMLWYTIITNI